MKMVVHFELGDGDDTKEVGIMVGIVESADSFADAVIVLRSGRVVTASLDGVEVVDPEIREMLDKVEDRSAAVGLEVDTEH